MNQGFSIEEQEFQSALKRMRAVLGDKDADRIESLVKDSPFAEQIGWFFAKTWGTLYDRGILSMRERALILMSTDLALGRLGPLKDHLKTLLYAGMSKAEIVEAMFQAAFYVGIPALAQGMQVANEVFGEYQKIPEPFYGTLPDINLTLGTINHVAMVVKSWRDTAAKYAKIFGLKTWKAVEIGPQMMTEMAYYGNNEPFTWISAFAKMGDTLLELCEPVSGRTVFADFLREHGEGMQHVGDLSYQNPQELVKRYTEANIPIGNYCNIGGMVKLYYIDTRAMLGGMFLEVVDPPTYAAIPDFGEEVTFS